MANRRLRGRRACWSWRRHRPVRRRPALVLCRSGNVE